ncbi:ABC transporter permease subunit [Xanthobacter sp. V4C-4]|uniref:ABC transporter permease subunit n=1 Tax=Xanthobacter cornucopiae TaxID=3119924 RepID=UPI00372ADFF6
MERRTIFEGWTVPALLLVPQMTLTVVFFLWPTLVAVRASLMRSDPFGLSETFTGLDNFIALATDPLYLAAVGRTLVFCSAVTGLSLGLAVLLAVFADADIRGRGLYRAALIWPYAVAPAAAGVVWALLLHPQVGGLARLLQGLGIAWNHRLDDTQAMIAVVVASSWRQVSYNFVFVLAALQSIPRTLLDAARLDGARGLLRFRTILLPLLAPTLGFLVAVNLVYSAFETFGTIEALTQGGPGRATQTLMVKVYRDGVVNMDLGASAAQSVVLMALVMGLTALQFRFLRRRKTP